MPKSNNAWMVAKILEALGMAECTLSLVRLAIPCLPIAFPWGVGDMGLAKGSKTVLVLVVWGVTHERSGCPQGPDGGCFVLSLAWPCLLIWKEGLGIWAEKRTLGTFQNFSRTWEGGPWASVGELLLLPWANPICQDESSKTHERGWGGMREFNTEGHFAKRFPTQFLQIISLSRGSWVAQLV